MTDGRPASEGRGGTGLPAGPGGPVRPRGASGPRLLSLHLPRFALERRLAHWARRGEPVGADVPLALVAKGPHGPAVLAASPAAEAMGVGPGARVVDARGVCPALRAEDADGAGDGAALSRLALWARRWCPWTAAEGLTATGGAGLAMDVTGSAHLWGGEDALLAEVERRLGALGLSARVAVAPTRGAAWALARFAGPRATCGEEDLAARMAPLPVRALRLSPDTARLLRLLGLRTVGDLLAAPRAALARRFARAEPGTSPLLRLDQMMGRLPEPLAPGAEPPRFAARAALAEPVEDPAPLLPALGRELCAMLAEKGFGARRVALAVYRTDGEVSSVEVATSRATRDPAHLLRLLEGKLERIDPGFGFDLVTLSAPVAERLPVRQPGLDGQLDGRREEGDDLAQLLDRLHARFGGQALRRPALRESHVPERREAWLPATAQAPAPEPPPPADRPLRLFDPPEEVRVTYALPEGPPALFVWRRVAHRVTLFAGPERIAPEWWREGPRARLRDYYRVEDEAGRRFWLFREGTMDDGRGGPPRWFVQGAFG